MNATAEAEAAHQLTIYEAEAAGALRRAQGHATAFDGAFQQALNALRFTENTNRMREAEKLDELFRLVRARLDVLTRRVLEGAP